MPPNYPHFTCKNYIPAQNNHSLIVPGQDNAVSEIVSFLLILAVLAAGIGIYAAVVQPELTKAEERTHLQHTAEEFCSLKSDIDLLWVLGDSGNAGGKLLPLTSADARHAGTLAFGKGTQIRFNHTAGQKTASLLYITYSPPTQYTLTYEGGAVFSDTEVLLPAVNGDKNAVLICTEGIDDAILANTPVAVTYEYRKKETFRGVENLQIAGTYHTEYWKQTLVDVESLTLVYCILSAEAVV